LLIDNQITPSFFEESTVKIAKNLLGVELIYNGKQGPMGGIITETEAYTQNDPACHAYGGKVTLRNEPMFLEAGHIYIYFIYGMYHCLNFVTEKKGIGAAVLIREIIPTIGLKQIKINRPHIKKQSDWLNGPGKLMLGLGIPTELNKTSLFDSETPLKLSKKYSPKMIRKLPRIGISKGQEKLWRFRYEEKNSLSKH